MNKKLLSLLCLSIISLSLLSCRKRQVLAKKDDVNTMIELDSIIFEEEETADARIIKF